MGWKDVKERISVPILTPDGISTMLDSCLENEGQNKRHSRTIVMDGYKSPIDDGKSVGTEKIEEIKYDLIRYMATSLLRDCDIEDTSKPVSQFYDGWNEHNKGQKLEDVTVGDLQEIASMSNDEIGRLIEEKSTSTIGNFIFKVYVTSCDIGAEHNGAHPVYPFEATPSTEKNTLWGYNKRMYLNPSLDNITTYQFLAEYIKKCIDRRIPFDMKGFGSVEHSEGELDGMVLYSSNQHFDQHLECLEEVIQENPDIMSTFGSPIYTGAKVNEENGESYYTIGAGFPCSYRNMTYNDYIDSAVNLTYLISSAKLIKQYFPIVSADYRELDEETRELIGKLSNLEQCSAEELQKIEKGNLVIKKQKETIRELAHKIIKHKEEKGTEQDKEEVMGKMKVSFSNSFKVVCSALKFRDKEHINTPIYADGSFIDLEKQLSAKDIAKADQETELTTSEVYDAKRTMETVIGRDTKKQERID